MSVSAVGRRRENSRACPTEFYAVPERRHRSGMTRGLAHGRRVHDDRRRQDLRVFADAAGTAKRASHDEHSEVGRKMVDDENRDHALA